MYLYDVEYVLSNGGMTLPLQGQCHSMRITKIEKMPYFGEITGPHSLLIQHCSCGQMLVGIFSKANIQYFIKNYDGLVKLVA